MNKRQQHRVANLLPGGKPKYIRVYDNGGETIDRYQVVFSGRYTHKTAGEHWILDMNASPFSPQGYCQHSTHKEQWDTYFRERENKWGWAVKVGQTHPDFGRRITFDDLPEPCQRAVMQDYLYLWDLPGGENHPSAFTKSA